jgi:hypothetical protein
LYSSSSTLLQDRQDRQAGHTKQFNSRTDNAAEQHHRHGYT